jgi:hypothetical protein
MTTKPIDPSVQRGLDAIGTEVTRLTSDNATLLLDREQDRRQLAAADARNQYLEKALAIAQRQRDYYLGKVVEITTHAGEIEHHYDRLRAALAAVGKMRDTEMPKPPGEETSDPSTSTNVDDAAAEARHQRTVRAFAPPRIRDAQQS